MLDRLVKSRGENRVEINKKRIESIDSEDYIYRKRQLLASVLLPK